MKAYLVISLSTAQFFRWLLHISLFGLNYLLLHCLRVLSHSIYLKDVHKKAIQTDFVKLGWTRDPTIVFFNFWVYTLIEIDKDGNEALLSACHVYIYRKLFRYFLLAGVRAMWMLKDGANCLIWMLWCELFIRCLWNFTLRDREKYNFEHLRWTCKVN